MQAAHILPSPAAHPGAALAADPAGDGDLFAGLLATLAAPAPAVGVTPDAAPAKAAEHGAAPPLLDPDARTINPRQVALGGRGPVAGQGAHPSGVQQPAPHEPRIKLPTDATALSAATPEAAPTPFVVLATKGLVPGQVPAEPPPVDPNTGPMRPRQVGLGGRAPTAGQNGGPADVQRPVQPQPRIPVPIDASAALATLLAVEPATAGLPRSSTTAAEPAQAPSERQPPSPQSATPAPSGVAAASGPAAQVSLPGELRQILADPQVTSVRAAAEPANGPAPSAKPAAQGEAQVAKQAQAVAASAGPAPTPPLATATAAAVAIQSPPAATPQLRPSAVKPDTKPLALRPGAVTEPGQAAAKSTQALAASLYADQPAKDTPHRRDEPPLAATPSATSQAADTVDRPPAPASAGVSPATLQTVAHLSADIARKLDARNTRFQIELQPAGLGRVDVKIDIGASGALSGSLNFDTPQSAEMLRAHGQELHAALERAGFDLSGGGLNFTTGGSGQDAPQQGSGQRAAAALPQHARLSDFAGPAAAPPAPSIHAAAAGRVDVRI